MSAFVGKDDQREEQVLLRVKDAELAKQLRQLLAGNEAKAKSAQIDLQFIGRHYVWGGRSGAACTEPLCDDHLHHNAHTLDDRRGTLTVGDTAYPILAQQLPSVVESYKTYDDINLVKTTDVGQVGMCRRYVHPTLPKQQQPPNHTPGALGAPTRHTAAR